MSDQDTSLPVRTQTNGDVVAQLVDGTIITQKLAIDASGKITAKLDDASGNGITSQVNGSQQALDVGINVLGVQIDPRQIRALTAADIVTVQQGTSPWVTKDQADGPVAPGAVASFSNLIGGQYNTVLPTLTNGQQAAIQVDSSGRILVDTSNTDDHNYGTVGANTLRTAAQIGNATGAADFNAGATGAQTLRTQANQGAPGTAANGWFTKITDGTDTALVTAAGELNVLATAQPGVNIGNVTVTNLPTTVDTNYGTVGASTIRAAAQVGNATGAADFNSGASSAQTLRVAANIYDSTGTAFSTSNPLPVTIADAAGTHINDYKDASSIAAAASDNHDYTVTAGKTLHLTQIESSGSGKAKMVLSIETGVATGVFTTKFAQFNSTATPNMSIHLDETILVAAGVRVRVTMTNRDLLSQDLYSTISGNEI